MKKLDGVLDLSANNLLKEVRMSASQATASVDGVILGYQPNLTHFIMTNRWELTALDLSSCPALSELNVDGCALSSLDLSHCPALKTLSAAFTKLTALDLSQNQQLLSLNCHHNTELNSLSLTGLSDLHQLSVQYTPIPVLDISPCPYLLALLENPAYYKDMGDRHLYETRPDSTADRLFLSKTTLLQTEAGQVFTTLTLPVSLNKIDVEAFAGIAADIVKVPQGCASIGSRAFADCPNLKLIYVSENTSLADDALSGCTYAYVVRYSS